MKNFSLANVVLNIVESNYSTAMRSVTDVIAMWVCNEVKDLDTRLAIHNKVRADFQLDLLHNIEWGNLEETKNILLKIERTVKEWTN